MLSDSIGENDSDLFLENLGNKSMNLLAADLSLSNDFSLSGTVSSFFDTNATHSTYNGILSSGSIPIHIPDSSEINITGTIKTYAPDSAPCQEYTKVLLQVTGFKLQPDTRYTYACQFSNKEVPAIEIAPGILEFHAPPQPSAGVVYFWIICKNSNPNCVSAQFSASAAFYYLPVDDTALVALQLSPSLADSQRAHIVQKFKYTVRDLDLSNSNLSYVFIFIVTLYLIFLFQIY